MLEADPNIYDHTYFCFQVMPKISQNATLAEQTLGATDLKHGMHTQLRSNIGGILPATPLPIGVN